MAGPLGRHAGGGQPAQLVVHERQQVGGRLGVALFYGMQDLGDVGHAAEYTPPGGGLIPKKHAARDFTAMLNESR
jgi:hypothetical protein